MTAPTTPTASRGCARSSPAADYTICASILARQGRRGDAPRPRRARPTRSSRRRRRTSRACRPLRSPSGPGRTSRSSRPSRSPSPRSSRPRARRAGARHGLALPARRPRGGGRAGVRRRPELRARARGSPSSRLRSSSVGASWVSRSPPGISSASSFSDDGTRADRRRRHFFDSGHLGTRPQPRGVLRRRLLARDRLLGLQGRAQADRGPVARRAWPRCSGSCRRSSGRSSTSSFGRPTRSRSGATGSSRTARSRSDSRRTTCAAPSAAARSTPRSSSAPSARPG